MKRALVLSLVVILGLAFAGVARTEIFDSIVIEGSFTMSGSAATAFTGATFAVDCSSTVVIDGATSVDVKSAGHIDLESADIRLGLDADDYMKLVFTNSSGNLAITHPGNTPSVTWTATSFDFVGSIAVDALTIGGTWTAASQTCSNLGSVTTCDINGGTINGITDLAVADGGTGSSNASDARTALGLAIGTNVQAYDAELDDIAGLTFADDKIILGTGAGTIAMADCSAFAQTILDDADASTARTTLGAAIGTNVQAWDAQLDDIAALVQSDSYIIVGDDSNWVAETGTTARASLGLAIGTNVQAYDAELAALAGLTSAANAIPYFTGTGTAGVISSSANMVTLLGSADYSAARTNLSLVPGTNVQAWDAQLDDIAALVQSDSYIIVGDDSNWVAETGATDRTSLGVAIGTNVQAWDAQLDDIAALVQSDSYIIVGDDSNWVAETGATARTSLGLAIGTNVQAWDAQLDDIAALVQSDSYIIVGDGSNWVRETGATARTSLGVSIGSDVQAHSADLTTAATALNTNTNDGLMYVGLFTITYAQTSSYTVCTVPANADVLKVEVATTTAFASGSATTIDIGWSGTAEGYASDLDIRSAGIVTNDEYGNLGDVGGSNRDVLAQITTDDSSGSCTVRVYWTTATPGTP